LFIQGGNAVEIRLAQEKDIGPLINMRWDFTLEDYPEMGVGIEYSSFEEECRVFLKNALEGSQWKIWVAEENGQVVSHIFIELINKVPRPGRVTNPFAYMTNVYTLPEYRGIGVGSKLLTTVNDWAKKMNYEFIIVWPSETSIEFYGRNGYTHCKEPMELCF
jgi:GNAT superfamily N-acetyltransferase